MQTVANRLLKHAGSILVEATAWGLACFCDAYPDIDQKRQLSQMRMLLARCQFRIAELQEENDNYKAMHELQHGPTVHLPLTSPPLPSKHLLN